MQVLEPEDLEKILITVVRKGKGFVELLRNKVAGAQYENMGGGVKEEFENNCRNHVSMVLYKS